MIGIYQYIVFYEFSRGKDLIKESKIIELKTPNITDVHRVLPEISREICVHRPNFNPKISLDFLNPFSFIST